MSRGRTRRGWRSWSRGRRIAVGVGAAVGVLAIVAGVVLAVSGGDTPTARRPVPTTTATTTTTLPPKIAPLTGLVDPTGASLTRPALSVKTGNTPEARPQSGVEVADVVYEEVVEGGITRLWAVYNSTIPETVGPIRSVRLMDPDIVSAIGGVIAFSGGTADNVALIRATPTVAIDENNAGDAFYRDPKRYAPHNLYGWTDKLLGRGGEPVPPRPLFAYLGKGETFPGERIASFRVGFSPGYDPTYTYDAGLRAWKRTYGDTPFLDADGYQVAPTNVVVQFVDYPAGSEGRLLGEGEAWVLSDGGLVRGRWSKPDPTTPTAFVDGFGTPIRLTPGRTWVELLPIGSAVDLVAAPPTPPTAPPITTTTTARRKPAK